MSCAGPSRVAHGPESQAGVRFSHDPGPSGVAALALPYSPGRPSAHDALEWRSRTSGTCAAAARPNPTFLRSRGHSPRDEHRSGSHRISRGSRRGPDQQGQVVARGSGSVVRATFTGLRRVGASRRSPPVGAPPPVGTQGSRRTSRAARLPKRESGREAPPIRPLPRPPPNPACRPGCGPAFDQSSSRH